MDPIVSSIVKEHIELINTLSTEFSPKILESVAWILNAIANKKKIMIAGNGGSAADAQHIAAEFVGRFQKNRRALPALALTTDTSIITALGNDFGYDSIFSRQIEGLKNSGDIFIGISTSGNSRNLIEAVKVCRRESIQSIGFLGNDGGKLGELVDLPIIIKSKNTARIQEVHMTLAHIICQLVENSLPEGEEKP